MAVRPSLTHIFMHHRDFLLPSCAFEKEMFLAKYISLKKGVVIV